MDNYLSGDFSAIHRQTPIIHEKMIGPLARRMTKVLRGSPIL